MRRIELTTENESFAGLVGSAFENPTSHKIVIVYINSADQPQTVHLQMKEENQSKLKSFIPYVTSDQGNLVAQPAQDVPGTIEIPPLSVVTLVMQEG
jgi:hypothetical protein